MLLCCKNVGGYVHRRNEVGGHVEKDLFILEVALRTGQISSAAHERFGWLFFLGALLSIVHSSVRMRSGKSFAVEYSGIMHTSRLRIIHYDSNQLISINHRFD